MALAILSFTINKRRKASEIASPTLTEDWTSYGTLIQSPLLPWVEPDGQSAYRITASSVPRPLPSIAAGSLVESKLSEEERRSQTQRGPAQIPPPRPTAPRYNRLLPPARCLCLGPGDPAQGHGRFWGLGAGGGDAQSEPVGASPAPQSQQQTALGRTDACAEFSHRGTFSYRGPTPQPFSPSQSYMQGHGEGSLLGPTQIPRTKDEADDPTSVESVEDKWEKAIPCNNAPTLTGIAVKTEGDNACDRVGIVPLWPLLFSRLWA
ncbi:hypothetical protein ACRRTK_009815 [Alexandromys fortis]